MAKKKKSAPAKSATQKAASKKPETSAPKSVATKSSSGTEKPSLPTTKPSVPPLVKPKPVEKTSARDLLRSRILGKQKSSKPIAFTLEEVREIARHAAAKAAPEEPKPVKVAKAPSTKIDPLAIAKPAQPHHVKAASLADILGFNPKKEPKPVVDEAENIPEKYRRYYKLLIELRKHLTEGIELHSEETLKRSSKDDSGDLSSYGQHMADAGTDTFDRDFALSLVSSEQEALSEIEAAIKRIHNGTYGICEISQKPIAKDRLLAVPFTRYSAEAQKEIEKNRYRARTSAGLFGELGEEAGKIMEDDNGDD